jgi:DNA replication and repair protein RecF
MIASLQLQDFRSYERASFEFDPGVSIIVGPNASGKTNLLEAIQVVCQGESYRVHDAELIRFGATLARLEAVLSEQKRSVAIERQAGSERAQKHYVINGQKLRRLLPRQRLPMVLFEPEHLRLIHAGPEKRRDFLDNLLVQLVPAYRTNLRGYKRTLAQRNALLKQRGPVTDQLFAWNIRLSELGSSLVRARQQLVVSLNQDITAIYQALSQSTAAVILHYQSHCDLDNYSSSLLKQLDKHLHQDQERGFTSYGPHREDIRFELKQQAAQAAASRGEVRTIVLALKVLEARLLEQNQATKPLLLLDDVFSELDGARRKALTNFLTDYQTFITTTDADVVVQHFVGSCAIIPTSR